MSGSRYALADRARRLLRAQGGRASEADLLTGLFGSAGGADRWSNLLGQLLEPCADLRRDPGGWWELRGPTVLDHRPLGSAPPTFVALSTTATGADPWRARLLAIAAVRVEAGSLAGRFEAVLNPRVRVPSFVFRTSGISQADLDDAPTFGDLVDQLADFFGDEPLVGLEIQQQLELLSHELARLDRVGLTNPLLELRQLADQAGLTADKPNLAKLAAAFGLTHPRPYYPPADARVVAQLASKLLPQREPANGSLEPAATSEPTAVASVLLRPDPPAAPPGPGVYLLRDAQGRVLYVGKARRLRRRLAEYHHSQLGLLRRLEGLASAVAEVETIATISELEALVLEARLVRHHHPPYNTQRQVRFPALFLRAALDPHSATLTACAEPLADGARYFGPFRTSTSAGRALRLVRALFPALRGRARARAAARWPELRRALEFLDGERDAVLDRLQDEQRQLAASGDHAALARSRTLLRRTLEFELDLSSMQDLAVPGRLLVLSPSSFDQEQGFIAHLIEAGKLRLVFEADSADQAVRQAKAAIDRGDQPIALLAETETADEPAIVRRWLRGLGPDCEIRLLPDQGLVEGASSTRFGSAT